MIGSRVLAEGIEVVGAIAEPAHWAGSRRTCCACSEEPVIADSPHVLALHIRPAWGRNCGTVPEAVPSQTIKRLNPWKHVQWDRTIDGRRRGVVERTGVSIENKRRCDGMCHWLCKSNRARDGDQDRLGRIQWDEIEYDTLTK